jgi:hypothetical protein
MTKSPDIFRPSKCRHTGRTRNKLAFGGFTTDKTAYWCKLLALSLFAILILGTANLAYADGVTFSDSTFNLSNYTSPIIFNSLPGNPAITVSQNPTAGSGGGDALQFNYTYPSPNLGSTTLTALINNGWNYTPSSQGAVGGINFSLDKKVVMDFTIGSITGPAIIEQGGNFYIDFISGLPIGGVYQTITGTDLQASDFGLYDFSTGTFNAAINPNFSATGAEIFFGVANRQNSGIVLGPAMTNVFFDNVSWNIVSAPEPGEWMLLAAGLFGVALMSKKLRHA